MLIVIAMHSTPPSTWYYIYIEHKRARYDPTLELVKEEEIIGKPYGIGTEGTELKVE